VDGASIMLSALGLAKSMQTDLASVVWSRTFLRPCMAWRKKDMDKDACELCQDQTRSVWRSLEGAQDVPASRREFEEKFIRIV